MSAILAPRTDGVVAIRAPRADDIADLLAGRDTESERWLGPALGEPRPAACIVVADEVVGWIDYDTDREWLNDAEVNLGYHVFAPHQRHGYATRAVELVVAHLRDETDFGTATLLIHTDNTASLALAARAGFRSSATIGDSLYFKRPLRVP